MSKIEVIGPKDRLIQVLGTIERSGTLQIDAGIRERMREGAETRLAPLTLDARTVGERLFYEDLALRLERLLTLLPVVPARETPFDPARTVNSIAHLVGGRLAWCEDGARRREAAQSEQKQLDRYLMFLTTVESLAPKGAEAAGLEVIAVEVRDKAALDRLTKVAGRVLLGAEVRTARGDDGSYIGLLTTEKQLSEQLRSSLRDDQIPEVSLPPYLEGLPLAGKIEAVRARRDAAAAEIDAIDRDLTALATRWRSVYGKVLEWLRGQLALLKTTGLTYGTDNCFVIFGWIPSARLAELRRALSDQYGEAVVVDEKSILTSDLDSVPVALRNPAYFQPFELLVRLLPLPRYASIDPTPFIGIFFPLIFGMILGDVGYGLILLVAAFGLVLFARGRELLQHAGRILGICAVWAALFGVLYGECFGDLGAAAIGLTPWIDRRTSFMPMVYFAVAVGGVHVVVGLALGVLAAIKGRRTKEAAFRLTSALVLLCAAGILVSYFAPTAALIRRPLVIAVAVIAPVLLVTGGLLAPFELLRYAGNIISYVRIMAVGLASVLLAYVANQLAGAAGSVWLGVIIAVVLHAFNLVLGVFAPAIHALRLHYVEFFSKFFEPGGRQYQPLKEPR
jgi:V/A-type H+-transporting ATPase subunit I